MQDEVNEKTIALYIKTGKLTAQTLQKAMKAILSKGKKQLAKPPQGKQSLKQLMKQNAGVSNIEITEGNIKAFESTAKKYGIDFALKKDSPAFGLNFKAWDYSRAGTIKGSIVGFSLEGGQTAYNSNVKEPVSPKTHVSVFRILRIIVLVLASVAIAFWIVVLIVKKEKKTNIILRKSQSVL